MNWSSDRATRNPARRRLAGWGVLAVGVLILLAACGGSSSTAGLHPGTGQSLAGMAGSTSTATGSAMPSMSMPPTSGQSAAGQPVSGTTVAIKNFAFSPASLVVKVGSKVTWTNQDTEAHTVTSSGAGGPLRSVALSTGQSYSYTFSTVGSYSYLCTIHPFMTAKVLVTK